MGGKHKQAQRTKNNARPSSSGRTAEKLGASINPFAGFSTIKDASLPVLSGLAFSSTSNDEIDNNMDMNFQLVLKKMNKKDSTTKLKVKTNNIPQSRIESWAHGKHEKNAIDNMALQEFTELVNSSQPEAVKAVLSVWSRLYAALAVDTEHRVREATHVAHRAVVLKVRREIAPYLKQLAGPWFTSQYDTYAPAASTATQSFNDAFPPNKVPEAIVFCQDEILLYICDNITVQTPQTLSNPKTTTPEDAEAKYERLLIASLQGYTLYLNKLTTDQIKPAEELNKRIISNQKFWKLCKTKIPLIRAAWFGCIVALFQKAHFLLESEIPHVISAVFCNLDESEPSVLGATWDAALYIISNIEDWWKHVSIEKLVLPKLWKVLKEAGQGSATVVYPNLLLLISHFPTTIDKNNLYGNFFENIRVGMKKRTVIQSRLELGAIATSFIECFRYIIMKNISDLDLCQSLISSHLLPMIEWSFTEENVITKILYSEISSLLQYWGQNRNNPEFINYNKLIENFWNHLEEIIKSSLNSKDQKYNKERVLSIINKQIDLFLYMKRAGISKQKKHKVQFISPDQQPGSGDSILATSESESENPIIVEINTLVHKTCLFYLKFELENKRSEVIAPVCILMQNFENEELFRYLNTQYDSGDRADNLVDLIRNVFLKFLKIKSTCSETVVDMVFIVYKYLTNEEKSSVLDALVKLKSEDTFCWCVAKALSHPLCNDSTIQKWLATPPITKLLVNIANNMLTDEISPDKSLLLKQAFSQHVDGELYISKEACQEIMLIFCNCLLSPAEYPFTIDVCASFAAQLASTLYTEQTLLTYGDPLVLALFSMSCSTNYDPETVSADTLWEVGTAWQDVLTIFITADLITEFENILWKFTKALQNEFITNDNTLIMDRLSSVTVDLIKCVLQVDDKTKSIDYITKSLLNLPVPLRQIHQHFTDICNCARIIKGDLTWPDNCPVAENILELFSEDSNILKYFSWNQFIIKVISSLFSKAEDDPDEDDDISDTKEAVLEESTDDINKLIVSALHTYATGKIFIDNYKSSKLYKDILKLCTVTKTEYSNFLNNTISKDMLENVIQLIESNNYDTTYILYNDLINNDKKKNIYINLLKNNFNSSHLTQIFSKHLTFDDIKEIKTTIEKFIITRMLLHSEDIDVQIAEALNAAMSIREKNVTALLYNRDVSNCKWQDIQLVVEIIRLLKAIIDTKPLYFSAQHWDFILISLTSWASSVDRSKDHYRQLQVAEFISAVCDLYMSFYKFIKNEELTSQVNQSSSNLVREYCDIFSHDVHVSLINTWMAIGTKELELANTCVTLLPALEIIGSMVSYFEDKYLIQVGNVRLPKWQTFVQTCGNLLRAPISVLQLWGYQGLKKAIPALIVLDETAAKEDENRAYGIISSQLGHVLTSVQEVVLTMLMDFKLGEESCRVESFTDSYTFTFAYLLLWDIFLSYCQHAPNDLRYQYSDWLRSGDYLKNLLNNIFRLMPTEVLHCTESRRSSVVDLFTVEPSLNLSDPSTSELLEHVVCWVYARALTHLPALVRQWWAEAEPRVAHTADQVTATHVSPVLCAHELRDVTERRKSAGENMRVVVHPSAREVVASYTVDEARMELVITLPANHPLGPVHVECSKQIGGTAQWRSWVMQLTVFLTHQNGRIWDGLSLWKSNLDKKFDGIEECYICFSVLHNATYQLPKLSCQTCKKKFHSPCLYKWFSTSNKSTCPICRNLF